MCISTSRARSIRWVGSPITALLTTHCKVRTGATGFHVEVSQEFRKFHKNLLQGERSIQIEPRKNTSKTEKTLMISRNSVNLEELLEIDSI